MPFVVLFVCAGNVCRSPTAELIFNSVTRSDLVSSTSSGLHALPGEPVYGPTVRALRDRGIDARSHRARLFVPGMAAQADLILTAERAQRDRAMMDAPRAFRRIFTLKEFLDCAAPPSDQVGAPLELPQIVSHAARRRSQRGPVPLSQDEIRDAYGQPFDIARSVAIEIEELVLRLSRLLAVGRPSPRPRAQLTVSRPRPRPPAPATVAKPRPRPQATASRPRPRPPAAVSSGAARSSPRPVRVPRRRDGSSPTR